MPCQSKPHMQKIIFMFTHACLHCNCVTSTEKCSYTTCSNLKLDNVCRVKTPKTKYFCKKRQQNLETSQKMHNTVNISMMLTC